MLHLLLLFLARQLRLRYHLHRGLNCLLASCRHGKITESLACLTSSVSLADSFNGTCLDTYTIAELCAAAIKPGFLLKVVGDLCGKCTADKGALAFAGNMIPLLQSQCTGYGMAIPSDVFALVQEAAKCGSTPPAPAPVPAPAPPAPAPPAPAPPGPTGPPG